MIQSYKDNETALEMKLKEFTYGGKTMLDLYRPTEDLNQTAIRQNYEMFRDMNRSNQRFKVNEDQKNMSFKSKSENKRVKFQDYKKAGSSSYNGNFLDLHGSMLDASANFDLMNRTMNSSMQKKNSSPLRQMSNNNISTSQKSNQPVETFTYNGLVERPDLFEKWLQTAEGQDFIVKNKLFHLKKEKKKQYVVVKKNQVNQPIVVKDKQNQRKKLNQTHTMGINFSNGKAGDEQQLLENFNMLLNSKSNIKHAKEFLNQRLMIGDKYSRTLRKHLNVVSDSNALQATLLQNQNRKLTTDQIENTFIPSYMIPEHYKSLLRRDEQQKRESQIMDQSKISLKDNFLSRQSTANNRAKTTMKQPTSSMIKIDTLLNDQSTGRAPFNLSHQNSLEKINNEDIQETISMVQKERKRTSKKFEFFRKSSQIRDQNNPSTMSSKEEKDFNLATKENQQKYDDEKRLATLSVNKFKQLNARDEHDIKYQHEASNQKKNINYVDKEEYEPCIPKLNLTFQEKSSVNFDSLNRSVELKINTLTRQLTPIHEEEGAEIRRQIEIKKQNGDDELNEEEPALPETTYEYQKFKTEAQAFMQGAKSAQKLNRISEKVKSSKIYRRFLDFKRRTVIETQPNLQRFKQL
ncbi:UNKNOWN [Stylonychia lemnae]|uniref:Uncharacterized protein n=1 Tax=Stylonychia lemnae TaxID=5949 RepID=A0A078A825_STYLE|nr:UNKNOWN [Stylonychia lemnae]|eukprot:CDW76926.1 UNKNOWN [Stylonychia lemnae]